MRPSDPPSKPSALYAALVVAAVFLGYRPRRRSSVARFAHDATMLRSETRSPSIVSTVVRNMAAQDWTLLAYLLVQLAVVYRGVSAVRETAIHGLELDLAVLCIPIILHRGQLIRPSVSALFYRLGLFGGLMGSFLQLHLILPTANPSSVDAQILAFDLRVFHVEPAIAWDQFVTTHTTEWFAFFYYGYFFLLAAFVLPIMFFERRLSVMAEFSFGILFLYCVAHVVYMLVPAYGPWYHLNGQFEHELTGSFWWPLVHKTVSAAGIRKDVFPSLHTAGPTFLTLFAFRHRRLLPFKYAWPLVAAFASQIIVATMFLRWHYLIDIIAGLTLATCTVLLTRHVRIWEAAHRERIGATPVWTAPFPWQRTRAVR